MNVEQKKEFAPALAHIENLWPRLTRRIPKDSGTLIGLPRPFPIPRDGGENNNGMFQEMYYWDSYFICLGLRGTPHQHLIEDVAENFAYLVERFGVIPNGARFYFLSRSQPPFFTQQIKLALEVRKTSQVSQSCEVSDHDWLARMYALAKQEHETVWLGEAQPHHRRVHRGLSRYFDINYLHILASCESGWDHSTRCDERWLEHLPVDLNSLLYVCETDLAGFAAQLGRADEAAAWRDRAGQRAIAMQSTFWDDAAGFFFDYDYKNERINPHSSLAGFYPLWAGWASPAQAQRVVREWLPKFLQPGGLVTTLKQEEGKQWAWPNGWAPLQWIVASGLDRYGFADEAREVRRRWLNTCLRSFNQTGKFYEKYNVVGAGSAEEGLYGQLIGFGWTNGVFVDFYNNLYR